MSSGYDFDLPPSFDDEAIDPRHMTPESPNAQLEGLSYVHFAIIYIDHNGKLCFGASPSIAHNCQTILSSSVMENFLRAVAMSNKDSLSESCLDFPFVGSEVARGRSPLSPQSLDTPGTDGLTRKRSISGLSGPHKHTNELETGDTAEQSHASGRHAKRKKVTHECLVPISITCSQRAMLRLRDRRLLRQYYEKAFENLQQINCRTIAKAYIKLVEPRKQVNYPYNGRKLVAGVSRQLDPEMTKPAWWPSGVAHKEPDHLLKAERVRLLIHILCELRDSHGITVGKLREADQSIRRQITPARRLQVLDEIYRVREEEESYLDGQLDEQAAVYVSRAYLPDDVDIKMTGPPTPPFVNSDMNPSYKSEGFDMETHTSVFPSGNPLLSHVESASGKNDESIMNANWNSGSLPSLGVPCQSHDGATALSVANPPITVFHQGPPPPVLSVPFPMRFYHDPSISHGQQQQLSSGMRTPAPDLGNCPHPYYFSY